MEKIALPFIKDPVFHQVLDNTIGQDTLAMKLNWIILVKPENQGKLFSRGKTAEAIPLSRVCLAVLFDL